jgi:hypothetical protein
VNAYFTLSQPLKYAIVVYILGQLRTLSIATPENTGPLTLGKM